MENVMNFLRATNAPDVIFTLLSRCVNSPERVDFHPEGTLDRHIEIVFGRASDLRNVNLQFAAILHDIMKPQAGEMRERDGMTWWTNPAHDRQAANLIAENEQVKEWIEKNGGDVTLVLNICKDHMKMKVFLKGERGEPNGMGERKRKIMEEKWGEQFEMLRLFSKMDNMLLDWDDFLLNVIFNLA